MRAAANKRERQRGAMRSIATKLIAAFLLVIIGISAVFSLVGVQFIGNRILAEAQTKVRTDLNSAREMYLANLGKVYDIVRFTADRFSLRSAILAGNLTPVADELSRLRTREKLDVLTVVDRSGKVLLRAGNPSRAGDDQSPDEMVQAVFLKKEPVEATSIVPAAQLASESADLAERARFAFVETPRARPRKDTQETSGMMLRAAAPIFDYNGRLIGVIHGGVLLNRNTEIVDRIKQTVFQDVKYKDVDIGTATIFQDDVRISTNVHSKDGARAVGTRIAEDVYDRVVREGESWIGRAYVVNNWYITAYEPIRNLRGEIIGILYVGLLEQKYLDLKWSSIELFLSVTLLGALASMALAYVIAKRISVPVQQLAAASRQLAQGNLDANVQVSTSDELHDLADSFNHMAAALKKRDDQLKEFATRKIMESERLAIIGQLAANVAHELNNPLQGIVSYSHLLLERLPTESPTRMSVQKIATQANRCSLIIRGLLDFSRQRKPQKRPANLNSVVSECVALVQDQALFHNISIQKNLQADLPSTVMDPSEMQQVMMNMFINAAEAMDGHGELRVSTRVPPNQDVVEVAVSDTGRGVPVEEIEHIFDPFFTTKEVGHGTGLGLAISFGIVKEHSGSISVESEIGKGTTFTLRLPLAAVEAEVASD